MRWVVGYEGLYLVHRDGYVVNRLGRTMTTKIDRYGYATVRLNRGGEQKWKKVHRLICEAWHGRSPSPTHHAAHLDGTRDNNDPANLVWATPGENERHKIAHGTSNLVQSGMPGTRNPNAKLGDEQVAYLRREAASGRSTRSIAKELGINQSRVVRIKNGQSYAQ